MSAGAMEIKGDAMEIASQTSAIDAGANNATGGLPSVDAASAGAVAATAAAPALAAAAAALTSTASSTVGAVAASAAASAAAGATTTTEPLRADAGAVQEPSTAQMDVCEPSKELQPLAPAWDAHLDSPPEADPAVNKMMQLTRCATLGLTTDNTARFVETCEFVSLGCFCAISNAMNLLGMKKNSYPFDWVRSGLDGVLHCLDMEFEDFLTYSTYNLQGQYIVFGGTRWGGSFWHHNVEAPLTKQDMGRRIERFYGRGSVPAKTPRFFARVVNNTRELLAAVRLRDTLRAALPEAQEVYLLLIVDLQAADGLMAVTGEACRNILFYAITEGETQISLQAGGAESFRLTSETYARAIAAAVRCWSGEAREHEVRLYSSLRELSAGCVHFDGGDPSRELFTPKKFYGQAIPPASGGPQMQHLFAKLQVQMFMVPANVDPTQPLQVECFGKRLKVTLPPGAQCGNALQLLNNEGVLSGTVSGMYNGQMFPVGPAVVEEVAQ